MDGGKKSNNLFLFLIDHMSFILVIIATISWLLSGYLGIFILTGLAFFLIICAILLDYQKKPVSTVILLCFIVLLFSVTLWQVENQPIYLSVGITAVMVIITTYYSSNNLRQQVKISENSGRKNYIAEIARSIFSAMQLDLLKARRSIENGPFFIGLLPPTTKIDKISPLSFLQGDVEIRGNPSLFGMSIERSIIASGRGPQRPARVLLTVPDETLQKKYLPVITDLCEKFENEHKNLDDSLNSMIQKSPLFFDDFKSYCDSLDKKELKEIFNSINSLSPQETFYHSLLGYALIQGVANADHYVNTDDGMRQIGKKQEFLTYVQENREILLEWLLKSAVSIDVKAIRKTLKNLIDLINQINDQINDLFLAWKVQYGLTEEEMNLKELYMMGF